MKQVILILFLGIAAGCYHPRPILMTVTSIENNDSEQKKVWGQVGRRVLSAVLTDLPDSVKVGSKITLYPASKAAPRKAKGRTFRVVRR